VGLNLSKLQKVKHQGNAITARCPVCAAGGHDCHGDHLFIAPDGRFGCVLNPGESGRHHRQKIFELVGIDDHKNPIHTNIISVNSKSIKAPEVIESNVLGRLGRLQLNLMDPAKS